MSQSNDVWGSEDMRGELSRVLDWYKEGSTSKRLAIDTIAKLHEYEIEQSNREARLETIKDIHDRWMSVSGVREPCDVCTGESGSRMHELLFEIPTQELQHPEGREEWR